MTTLSMTIVLIHAFNKERHVVPVDSVAKTYVSVRWGQSGVYDLNLKDNVLTARSQKAQRKGKAHWAAEDIVAVRKMVKDHFDGKDKKAETRANMAKHEASMPVFPAEPFTILDIEPFPSYEGDPEIEGDS